MHWASIRVPFQDWTSIRDWISIFVVEEFVDRLSNLLAFHYFLWFQISQSLSDGQLMGEMQKNDWRRKGISKTEKYWVFSMRKEEAEGLVKERGKKSEWKGGTPPFLSSVSAILIHPFPSPSLFPSSDRWFHPSGRGEIYSEDSPHTMPGGYRIGVHFLATALRSVIFDWVFESNSRLFGFK